jgi:hypothetical protein
MPTKRTAIVRESRWRVTPFAIKLWAQILELQQQPRDRHGELASDSDRNALRETWNALAADIGASKFLHEPHRIKGDRPWDWIHDTYQLQMWEESRQVRDALNCALLAQTQVQEAAG